MDYKLVGEKERAKKMFMNLTNDKRPTVRLLYEMVSEFIFTIVQDDICLSNQYHENSLRNILCHFSFAFVPIPLKNQLEHHGSLVNKKKVLATGSNSRIYNSGLFEGNPIVTKTKKKWTEHTIYEVFINFVIINTILLEGQLTRHLIPSYGLFVCGSNKDGTEICVNNGQILPGEHIFLVQLYIEGDTLSKRLDKSMSLSEFKSIIKVVFDVMLFFEKSIYQLYHMDIHGGNIILSGNNIYIIDFELASWTLFDKNGSPHRYRLNSVEHKYCEKDIILTGAYDVLFLMISSAVHEKNKEIQEYCMSKIQSIYSHLWKDENTPYQPTLSLFSKNSNRWMYHVLLENEKKLKDTRQKVHQYNIQQLNKMTCDWIIKEYFYDL